ncbi:hypothetical protein [Blastococcus sp. TF02A-35]|uniref:hypothetical protein n=1 Tax=Blastococcus sp. TF02A-35 TaxID=2559612 RepID=UPI0010742844|nr:hypothetical protein [Blastococcus sp. TF02A_35]TFV43776.1 hypothetical protein E4P43_19395 [Blastococcus sp. TF02A_35]
MPARRPLALRAGTAALVVLALAGCSTDERSPGEPITADEAEVLAELLHRNHEEGGADFVVTVPFGDDALLTLTGEVDFRRGAGRAQAVTVADDEERDTRTLFFDRDELWAGDVPGLPEALAADGAREAVYLRRSLPVDPEDPELLDVLVEMLLNLAQPEADDPELFLDGPYRWHAEQPIDGRPTTVYRLREGRTVAVDAGDQTLVQYRATLPDSGLDVTLTLAEHGTRRVALPSDDEAAAAADHPAVAAAFGI